MRLVRGLGPFTRTWADVVPGVLAKVLQVAALVSLLGGLGLAHWRGYRVLVEPFWWLGIPTGSSLFSAVLLFIWAATALRRKRVALWLAVLVEGLTVVESVVVLVVARAELGRETWTMVASTVLCALVLVPLLAARRAFPGRLVPGAWRQALTVAVVGLGAVTLVGLGILAPYHHRIPGFGNRLRWVLERTIGTDLTALLGNVPHHGPHWASLLLSFLAACVVLAALTVFLRSSGREPRSGDDLRVRRLLLADDGDSLGYFATRRDRLTVFSSDGRAAVSFGVSMGVAMAAGDPIGARHRWEDAIMAWLDECRTYGWVPAVISAGEDGARAYKAAGLTARRMGDEAIIEAADFELRAHPPVAKAVRRVRASGATVQVRRLGDLIHEEREQLRRDAAAWREGDERGFSMALDRTFDDVDEREVVTTVHGPDGELEAMLGFSPWGMRGASLDVMRRSPEAVNGVNEAMVVALLTEGPGLGVDRVSLNFAMFRTIFVDGLAVDASPQARLLARLMRLASRFWQLEQLYESNAKYGPRWNPRYLCYLDTAQFVQVVLAAGVLEGFVPVPRWVSRRRQAPGHELEGDDYARAVAAQVTEHVKALMPTRRLTHEETARRQALSRLVAEGVDPYPVGVEPGLCPDEAGRLVREWIASVGQGTARTGEGAPTLRVEGRVGLVRDHGGLVFAELTQGQDRLQVLLDASVDGLDLDEWRATVDRGDCLVVTGTALLTRTGEPSVRAQAWTVLAKTLTALPRPRPKGDQPRYVPVAASASRTAQLLADPEALDLLRQRSTVVSALRSGLGREGYTEVETPILQAVHGGANARPFVTHLNAYDAEVYLRIAPELYLKRLAVAGMDAVFEIGRNFRNEGVDATHNPEFTSLEAYVANGDYTTMRLLTERLVQHAATAVHGAPLALRPAGSPGTEGLEVVARRHGVDYVGVDLSGHWPVVTVHKAISAALGREVTPDTPVDELAELVTSLDLEIPPSAGAGDLVGVLYDEFVEARTLAPTFYTDFPVETSPLTRHHRRDPRLAERWDLVAWGSELGTAYSELTDPLEQRERFTAQSLRAAAGDPEAMSLDEDFLRSLELGLVPTGGLGLGVDRVAMLATGASTIREVLAFPYSRPVV